MAEQIMIKVRELAGDLWVRCLGLSLAILLVGSLCCYGGAQYAYSRQCAADSASCDCVAGE